MSLHGSWGFRSVTTLRVWLLNCYILLYIIHLQSLTSSVTIIYLIRFFSLPFTAEIKVLMILMRRKFHQHYDAVGWPCYISTVACRSKAEGAAESVVTDTHKISHILTNWHPSQKLYQSTPALKLFYRAFPQYKQCITTPSTLNVCHVCVTHYYRKANKKQKKVFNT